MRFGVREICDVVFKPLAAVDIGKQHFDAMQPVLYLDTAKTSTLEGAATTVYAQGGKGNPRLIGWDGEKTLTFTVEDALMSPLSFHVLSGAGVVKGVGKPTDDGQKIYVHQTYDLVVKKFGNKFFAELTGDIRNGAQIIASVEAPIYATTLDSAGAQDLSLSAIASDEIYIAAANAEVDETYLSTAANKAYISPKGTIKKNASTLLDATDRIFFELIYDDISSSDYDASSSTEESHDLGLPYTESQLKGNEPVRIDCYAVYGDGAQELQIDANSFAGYYYIEASTLFRDEATGQDFPAEFVIPRGKIQSNFTFTMANSGDPSTFTFTIDAFPAYTKFDQTKKVMAALQIIDPKTAGHNYDDLSVRGHNAWRKSGTTTSTDTPGAAIDSEDYYNTIYIDSVTPTPGPASIANDEPVVTATTTG